ncbi:hypothetical protein [Agromyces allii]|uniref:Uncharacterized protein n=1 Tax=Agromyces allii TaxID=393607 RepID=A0ABP5BZC9_9MICO|nr:hypothetical protein [Agromyces allii]
MMPVDSHSDTKYVVYAAEDDINKLFYNVHVPMPVLNGLVYGVAPDSGGPFEIRDSGIVTENVIG